MGEVLCVKVTELILKIISLEVSLCDNVHTTVTVGIWNSIAAHHQHEDGNERSIGGRTHVNVIEAKKFEELKHRHLPSRYHETAILGR